MSLGGRIARLEHRADEECACPGPEMLWRPHPAAPVPPCPRCPRCGGRVARVVVDYPGDPGRGCVPLTADGLRRMMGGLEP